MGVIIKSIERILMKLLSDVFFLDIGFIFIFIVGKIVNIVSLILLFVVIVVKFNSIFKDIGIVMVVSIFEIEIVLIYF